MLKITSLTALDDNYIWVIESLNSQWSHQAWVVDPGESQVVLDYLQTHQLKLAGLLITHHHYDHVEGIDALKQAFPMVPVYGSKGLASITHPIKDQDNIVLFDQNFTVMATPGHTSEHICFIHPEAIFSGDTVFTGGCGRCFSNDFSAFADSLIQLKKQASAQAKLYCGHEYTWANLNFAKIAEPNNQTITQRIENTRQQLKDQQPCVPSNWQEELETNPFLRFNEAPLKSTLLTQLNSTSATNEQLFKTLRKWKDRLDTTGELEPAL